MAQGHKANSHRRKYCSKKGNDKGHKTQSTLDSCLGNNQMAKYIMTQRDVPLGNFLSQLQEKER